MLQNLRSFKLILIVLGFWASLAVSKPVCPAAFERLVQSFEKSDEVPEKLPKHVSMAISKSASADMFFLANAIWNTTAEDRKVPNVLAKVSEGEKIKKKEINALKDARKMGNILRSAFTLYHAKHKAPKGFRHFVRDFGKLNDAIDNGAFQESARLAQDILETWPEVSGHDFTADFSAESASSQRRHLKSLRKGILEKLAKGKIPAEDFHDVRKEFKEYLNYFRLLYSLKPSEASFAAFHYTKELNDRLGDLHDEAIAKHFEGEEHYEDARIKMSKSMRKDIKYFLKRVKITSRDRKNIAH